MDGESPEAGAFLLLINFGDHEVVYMNGPWATVQVMSSEDFRRVWSGVALIPAESHSHRGLCLAAFAAGLAVPAACRLGRLRPAEAGPPRHSC